MSSTKHAIYTYMSEGRRKAKAGRIVRLLGVNAKRRFAFWDELQSLSPPAILLPYQRIQDYFVERGRIPISAGSLYNSDKEAFGRLVCFDEIACNQLQSRLLHGHETVSTSTANASGRIAPPTTLGGFSTPIPNGAAKRWMRWLSSLGSTAFYAMTTGSPTSPMIVPMPCATPIT